MSSRRVREDAWDRLRRADLVAGAAPAIDDDTPWYLAALIGVSAWVAAGFVFGFFSEWFSRLWDAPALAFALGAGCCVSAWGLLRVAKGRDFIEQSAIVCSLAGQGLIGMAIVEWCRMPRTDSMMLGPGPTDWRLAWMGIGAVAALMYALGRQSMHRFLCGLILSVALLLVCFVDVDEAKVLAVPALGWAMLALWWRSAGHDRFAPAWPPLAWAMTLVLLLTAWLMGIDARAPLGPDAERTLPLVPLRDALTLPLLPVCAAWWSYRQGGTSARRRAISIVSAAVLGLVWLRAPGVNIGVVIVLLGFALHRPALLGVGAFATGAYLLQYYHQLETTLLQKSYWLLGGGAALLAVRWAWLRFARGEAA
ncbi:MAG: DUF4401 domain-containing protein [Pseudomonadota bacterium]